MAEEVDVSDFPEAFAEETQSNISLPKLAHLGFHAQPTRTPKITAIHNGAISTMSSLNTSPIVGFLRISRKTEAKPISAGAKPGISKNDPDKVTDNQSGKIRKTLDSIRKVSVKHSDFSRVFKEENP